MIAQFYSVESLIFVECMTSGLYTQEEAFVAGRDGKDRHKDRRGTQLGLSLTSQELNGNIKRPTTTIMEQLRINIIAINSEFGHFAISLYCYDACQFVIISLC